MHGIDLETGKNPIVTAAEQPAAMSLDNPAKSACGMKFKSIFCDRYRLYREDSSRKDNVE